MRINVAGLVLAALIAASILTACSPEPETLPPGATSVERLSAQPSLSDADLDRLALEAAVLIGNRQRASESTAARPLPIYSPRQLQLSKEGIGASGPSSQYLIPMMEEGRRSWEFRAVREGERISVLSASPGSVESHQVQVMADRLRRALGQRASVYGIESQALGLLGVDGNSLAVVIVKYQGGADESAAQRSRYTEVGRVYEGTDALRVLKSEFGISQ